MSPPYLLFLVGAHVFPALTLQLLAQQPELELEGAYELPELTVWETRVANTAPAGTVAMPVTLLRYEPCVDVQSRGLAEGQADVTVRGGVFENTGFKLGAVTLIDPQTGHYFSDLPFDPNMFGPPEVLTGVDNALAGFNSNVATINYNWAPIASYGLATVGFGTDGLNFQRMAAGYVLDEDFIASKKLAAELSYSRSEADGTRPYTDHELDRLSARLQLIDEQSQTDFYAGYHKKFYGWPGAYTGDLGEAFIGRLFYETDQTTVEVYGVNHLQEYAEDSFFEVGGYYRRVRDDYDTNRTSAKVSGTSGAFEHRTQVIAWGAQGRHQLETWAMNYGLQVTADELLYSTDLTYPTNHPRSFYTRRYLKATLLPEVNIPLGGKDILTLRAGASFDDSDRDSSALSPQLEAIWESPVETGLNRYFASYSRTTQVPGYTALASGAGLFGGNPGAGREIADSFELGIEIERRLWMGHLAGFYRMDDDLVDWTFTAPAAGAPPAFIARSANPVDIKTFGIEAIAKLQPAENWELVLGYTFLNKISDYQGLNVTASFYALNYANHRWTAALAYRPLKWLELRLDNEYRMQEDDVVRTRSDTSDEDYIGSLGLGIMPRQVVGLSIDLVVDNISNSNFQEFPGTPAARRQAAMSITYQF